MTNKFVSEQYVIIGDMKYVYAGGSITPLGLKKQFFKCETCPGRIHVYEDIRRFQLVKEHTAMLCSLTHRKYMESYNMAVQDMISIMEPENSSMFSDTLPLDWDDTSGVYRMYMGRNDMMDSTLSETLADEFSSLCTTTDTETTASFSEGDTSLALPDYSECGATATTEYSSLSSSSVSTESTMKAPRWSVTPIKKSQAATTKGYIPTPAGKTPPPRRVHFNEAFVKTPAPKKKSGIPVESASEVRATTKGSSLLAQKEVPSSSRQENSEVPKLAKSKPYKYFDD